jgi:branched-subunit amino acid aminotransferase/4-amino-4-deoxychorismate lyase
VVPVVEIDGRKIGAGLPGPITTRLAADFHAHVRGG